MEEVEREEQYPEAQRAHRMQLDMLAAEAERKWGSKTIIGRRDLEVQI